MVTFKKSTKKGYVRFQMMEGCVCDSLTVDGKEEMDMSDDERREALRIIFDALEPDDLNNVLQELIPMFGDCISDDEPCECCGDYVSQYTWDIKLKR